MCCSQTHAPNLQHLTSQKLPEIQLNKNLNALAWESYLLRSFIAAAMLDHKVHPPFV